MASYIRRRKFLATLGGAGAAWPLAARAQQPTMPVVGFINLGVADASANRVAAFRKGVSEAGYAEGQNVIVEYHWLEGHYERLPAVLADLVRRRVAVITTSGSAEAALAAKNVSERAQPQQQQSNPKIATLSRLVEINTHEADSEAVSGSPTQRHVRARPRIGATIC
jgi:hypothetical protein